MARNTLSGGNFLSPNGTPNALGYLKMKLNRDCQINGNLGQIGRNSVITVPLDVNGNVSGTVSIWPNDQLNPSGNQYIVKVYLANGQPVNQFNLTVTSSPSPFVLP